MFIVNEFEDEIVFKSSVFSSKVLALRYCACLILNSIKEWDMNNCNNKLIAKELEEHISHKEFSEAFEKWNMYEPHFGALIFESEIDKQVELITSHKCLDCVISK